MHASRVSTPLFRCHVVPPQAPADDPVREAGRKVEAEVFWEKDRNTREELSRHYDRFASNTWWVVMFDERSAPSKPAGAMRLVTASHQGLPSVNDIAGAPWGVDPVAVLTSTRDAQGSPLPDLRFDPQALDIVTVAVPAPYRKTAVVWGLYAQTCKLSRALRMRYWSTILDTAPGGAFESIQERLQHPFQEYAGGRLLKRGVYFADLSQLDPGAIPNASLPLWCDIPQWFARQRAESPETFGRLWEGGLSATITFEREFEPVEGSDY